MYMSAANKQSKKAKRVQDLIKNIKNKKSQFSTNRIRCLC